MLTVPKNITPSDLAKFTLSRNSAARVTNHMYSGYTLANPTTELFLPGNEVLLLPVNSASHVLVRTVRHDYKDYIGGSSNYEALFYGFSARVHSDMSMVLSNITMFQGTAGRAVINQQATTELQAAFDVATLANTGRQYLRHTVRGWFVGDNSWVTYIEVVSTPNH
ncbi:hypothetical protein [Arthronema virus TR020]|uniref:Uncharacterized protein n=1 Tax=Arthronema virus TR020 TaxID=2736280 RepID=A0A7G3WH56_9CAUD|nr:hypothetical protein [Arthronema virus TR020]